MPTYDYQCRNCGYIFEAFQSIAAEPLTVCPNCEQPDVHRILSGGAGVIFKGSGFYQTDYKHSHSTTNSSTETKPEKKTNEP
ncbi:MAG TPA: zinc ribbon domain-containing protein [bacterium]|nr:zinc ribbon domain-containing protein [bacterium]HPG83713.1 zinc ribbon domain-containing protein [bacterium]HPM60581.1 zinc ribbon domain-containing protein [bacterium]